MTVSSATSKTTPAVGNGVNTSFPFAFKVFVTSDLDVVFTSTAGVETTLTTTYSVVLNADQDTSPGGTVTYPVSGTPLAAGEYITVVRTVDYTQDLDLVTGGNFSAVNIENAFDRIVMMTQQLYEKVSRALRFPISDTGLTSELPTAMVRAGKYAAFDASGNVTVSAGTGNDSALRTDLAAAASGDALIAVERTLTGAVPTTVHVVIESSAINAKADFGIVGDGTDETVKWKLMRDAAVSGTQILLQKPSSFYGLADEIVFSEDNISILGLGGMFQPEIKWIGSAAPTLSMIRFTNASYCTLKDVRLNGNGGVAYGAWITSAGSAVTQFNILERVRVDGVTDTGIKVGNSNNLDTNVDGNMIIDCSVDSCTLNSVAIDGTNINQTFILRGTFGAGTNSSVAIGTYARGVYIDGPLFVDTNAAAKPGLINITNKFTGMLEIKNIVVELANSTFLYAAQSDVSNIAYGMVLIKNFICSCNYTAGGLDKIIYYGQHGLLSIEGGMFVGRPDGTNTYIKFDTPDISGPGLRTLRTKDVLLLGGNGTLNMNFAVPSTANSSGAETTWIGDYRQSIGGSITAGPRVEVAVNAGSRPSTEVVMTYSTSMNINAALSDTFRIVATDGVAFTINNPTNMTDGMTLTITISNTSGGALGAITWGSYFKLAAWTSPATANRRSITYRYSSVSGNLEELSRNAADVPN